MALAVNLRYENNSYASAFDQSRRSLLLRPIRIALLLKLAVPVRMGYTCPYGLYLSVWAIPVRMGLASELRRRNVFRVVVLHAIVAWLI